MDPTATYNELVLAQRRGDSKDAREYAQALYQWLTRGGFAPVGADLATVRERISWTLDPYGNHPLTWTEKPAHPVNAVACGVCAVCNVQAIKTHYSAVNPYEDTWRCPKCGARWKRPNPRS